MVPVTAPRFGIVPVILEPFTYAVLLVSNSAATAFASEVSASYAQVPVVASPEGKWNFIPFSTDALVTSSLVKSSSVYPPYTTLFIY